MPSFALYGEVTLDQPPGPKKRLPTDGFDGPTLTWLTSRFLVADADIPVTVVVLVAVIIKILVVTRVGRSEALAREPVHDPIHTLGRRAVPKAVVSRIGLNQRRGIGVLLEESDLRILRRGRRKRIVIRDQEQQWRRPHQMLTDASQRCGANSRSDIADRRQHAVLIGAVRVVDLRVGTRLVERQPQTVVGDPRGAGAKVVDVPQTGCDLRIHNPRVEIR